MFLFRRLGMATPTNGLQPYTTITYANGPGFHDHFDNVNKNKNYFFDEMMTKVKI